MHRNALSTTVAIVTITILAGCVPAAAPPSVPPSATASSTPSVEPTPPTPTAAPIVPATCENLLDPAELASYDGFGGVNLPVDFVARKQGEDSQFTHFIAYGGVACGIVRGVGGEVTRIYAYSSITPDQQSIEIARLESEGFTAGPVDGGTMYTSPLVGSDGAIFNYYFRNGYWWCDNNPELLAQVVALSPAS